MHRDRQRALGYASLVTAGSLWGTGFVFGKWALEELSVGEMVLLRFAFASVALVIPLWREHRRAPIHVTGSDLRLMLSAGFIGIAVQYLVQFGGLARTTVSHASLLVGVLPVMLAVAAVFFAHERLDAIGWSGLVASTVGAALVAFGGGKNGGASGATLIGDAMVVVSLVAGVAWILMSQRLMQRKHSPVSTTALVIIVGTFFLAVWVIATEGLPPVSRLSWRAWTSVAAMGVLATAIATLLWNWGLARVPASQAGVFVNLEPVVGAILGVLLFGDAFGVWSVAGGVLIVGAAVVVSLRKTSGHGSGKAAGSSVRS
jgi:drug/metabolite transporter (DMT)-like permease